MSILKNKYRPPTFNHTKRHKSMAVPDQTLSLQEIVRRYTRGIAIDAVQREPVYVDQSTHDLEKITRMDVYEKTQLAAQIKEQRERDIKHLQDVAQAEKEADAAADKESTHRNASDDDDEGGGGRQHVERATSRKASRPSRPDKGHGIVEP